jgi:hydrogenase small subunit
MNVSRRDFLKASAAITGAIALKASGLLQLEKALANGASLPPVIWLQGQGCTGCSVSLLNSIYYTTVDDLLINTIDLKFHPTVMAAAGELAVEAAEMTREAGGYVLVVEGAIPVGEDGHYCHVWENGEGEPVTLQEAIETFAPGAAVVLGVGTCGCYGGMSAGSPNPTRALGVGDALDYLGLEQTVINIPGCPAHPDWIIGTVAALLAGEMPELDKFGRPKEFFGQRVHERCPNRGLKQKAKVLSDSGCLAPLGCKGQQTYSDCPIRQWNSAAQGQAGTNWCIGARNPCQGCTEPNFPDKMSPFYNI